MADTLQRWYRTTFVHDESEEPAPQGTAPRGLFVAPQQAPLFSTDAVDGGSNGFELTPLAPPAAAAASSSSSTGLSVVTVAIPPPTADPFTFAKPPRREDEGPKRGAYMVETTADQQNMWFLSNKAMVTLDNSLVMLLVSAVVFVGVLIVFQQTLSMSNKL